MTSTSVERVIPAPPDRIFDLLADPTRHPDIDGSGTVVGAKEGSRRLALGDKFGMDMKLGRAYSMVSTVIEFEENRRIAWQSRPPKGRGGGRIWRYELEPTDGGTRVRETWDMSQETGPLRPLVRLAKGKTQKNMKATLERIEQLTTS